MLLIFIPYTRYQIYAINRIDFIINDIQKTRIAIIVRIFYNILYDLFTYSIICILYYPILKQIPEPEMKPPAFSLYISARFWSVLIQTLKRVHELMTKILIFISQN